MSDKYVMLAKPWNHEKQDITGWWISEKLDGVRAYWTGTKFISRTGKQYFAPAWFTKDLPSHALDGELWCGRGLFQKTVSYVRKSNPIDAEWEKVIYVVFDAPEMDFPFEKRMDFLNRMPVIGHLTVLHQEKSTGNEYILNRLEQVEKLKGEGLMARKPGSFYEKKRSSTLLKIKNFFDAEAKVVGHSPGKGKNVGRLGALECVTKDGTEFSVGTGFSDSQRSNPLPIGTIITFRYQELTDGGTPRFPSFVGERVDHDWS